MYLAGVSTRRVDKLVRTLGIERHLEERGLEAGAEWLDQIVEDFRTRPLDGAPYAYVTLDALVVKCREGGRTVNVCVVHAVGVNRDGFRESLGLDVVTSEDGAAWLAFMRGLVARGLTVCQAGQLGRTPRPRRRDRLDAARRGLATLPHPLHAQPVDAGAQERPVVRGDDGSHDLRPARRQDSA